MANKMWYEEDDNLLNAIDDDAAQYTEYIEGKVKGFHTRTNGIPTSDPLDQGRNCPRCSGRLMVKEVTDKGNVALICKKCGAGMFAEDIDERTEIIDKLYRKIPDQVINKWLRSFGIEDLSQKESL